MLPGNKVYRLADGSTSILLWLRLEGAITRIVQQKFKFAWLFFAFIWRSIMLSFPLAALILILEQLSKANIFKFTARLILKNRIYSNVGREKK